MLYFGLKKKQGEVERTPDTVIDCKLGGAVGLHDWHLKGGSPRPASRVTPSRLDDAFSWWQLQQEFAPSSLQGNGLIHLHPFHPFFKVCVSIWRLVFLASHKLPPPVHSNFFSFLSFSINASLYVQSYKMPISLHRAKSSICDNFVTLTKQIWLKMILRDNN